MRTGKTHQQIAMLAKSLSEDKSVFVAGMKNPKEYTDRLFKDFGIEVTTEPHYITKDTEIVLEDVPPYRVWETKYEPILTGYEFKKIMKVKCKVREITEKELDLEYPYYLAFQDELCNDKLIKVFPEYEIVVKYEVGGMKIEKTWCPFYEEYQILNNLTTEEHFEQVFKEALKQITDFKDGK
jgi:hypothetical protein